MIYLLIIGGSPRSQASISSTLSERRLKGSYLASESGTEDGGVLKAPYDPLCSSDVEPSLRR